MLEEILKISSLKELLNISKSNSYKNMDVRFLDGVPHPFGNFMFRNACRPYTSGGSVFGVVPNPYGLYNHRDFHQRIQPGAVSVGGHSMSPVASSTAAAAFSIDCLLTGSDRSCSPITNSSRCSPVGGGRVRTLSGNLLDKSGKTNSSPVQIDLKSFTKLIEL